MSIKYSFLVPVYNVEEYLSGCLDSILFQSGTDVSYEIIITDDGSTDASPEICDRYASEHSIISVIHQDNAGLLGARISGMKAAAGEYLIFVDSDDHISADLLCTIDHVIDENSPDVLMYGYNRVSDSRSVKCRITDADGSVERDNLIKRYASTDRYNNIWLKAVRRSAIIEHIGELSGTRSNNAEDRILTALLLKYCKTFYVIKECLYQYNVNDSGISRNADYDSAVEFIHSHVIALNIFEEALRLSDLTAGEQQECIDEFRGLALNGIMEQIFKMNATDGMSSGDKADQLAKLLRGEMQSFIKAQTIRKIKNYNRIRLKLLNSGRYSTLVHLDKGLVRAKLFGGII